MQSCGGFATHRHGTKEKREGASKDFWNDCFTFAVILRIAISVHEIRNVYKLILTEYYHVVGVFHTLPYF